MFKHLFGPVPSRRLGMSLGVDLIPSKICSLNCVYCECGKTTTLTNVRKTYIPTDAVMAELKQFLEANPAPDYITFSGAGEPTLHSGIGEIVDFIKNHWQSVPLALLTNGTLFYDKTVRREIMKTDLVLPSLDAAIDTVFRKIDRPFHNLQINNYIDGLIAFREEYTGKIWLEVFVLPGYNDAPEYLEALKAALLRIKPDKVQLNTLDRPGTIGRLRPANKAELNQIVSFLAPLPCEIIAAPTTRKDIKSYRDDIEDAILETIARRPCTLEDLATIFGVHINEINKYLSVLDKEQHVETIRQERGVFYKLKK